MKSAPSSRVARAASALIAGVLASSLATLPVRADTESELNDAKARLTELVGQIESGQARIASLQSDANALAKRIDQVQSRIAETQSRIIDVQKEIKQTQAELAATQDQLDRRAWVAYQTGPGISVEFLLGSTSLADLADRLKIVDRAAQSDRDLINEVEALQTRLREKREGLKALEKDQRSTRDALQADFAELEGKLAAQERAVQQLASDKAEAAELVEKLGKKLQAEKIAAEKRRLEELERQRREQERQERQQQQGGGGGGSGGGGSGGGGGGGGGVSHHPFKVCPVQGSRAYGDDFGAPRYGGGFHPHAGNDIFASRGVPIAAPFSGTAVDATNGLGGLAVKVLGSEGWVYNAHLDSIGTLGAVSAGTIIGTVGDSGDAQGGATHDHFEWHPNDVGSYASQWTSGYGYSQIGSAVDPYPYLNQVC